MSGISYDLTGESVHLYCCCDPIVGYPPTTYEGLLYVCNLIIGNVLRYKVFTFYTQVL